MSRPAGLRRFARAEAVPAAAVAAAPEPAAAAEVPERCELCSTQVPAGHGHIADTEAASLLCACRACYLLFTQPGGPRRRYAAVPDRYLGDPGASLSPSELDQLQIPVGLAFFLRTSRDGQLAGFYPSPGGATQCELDLAAWRQLADAHPLLAAAADDVEAVLISKDGPAGGAEYYVVPVDVCYELAGAIRLSWRGFDGGAEAREHIAAFLARVRDRARPWQAAGA